MTDPYLLLTPLLALAVLGLARFVGCDRVFGLEPVPDWPEELPFVESMNLGRKRNDGNDPNPFTGWAGMAFRVGAKPITVTQLGRIMVDGSTVEHQVKIVERAGTTGIDRGMVSIPPSPAILPTMDNPGFAYAALQPNVVLTANTEYYVVSYEAANSDLFYDLDTTVTTKLDAEVTSSVYDIQETPPNPDSGYERPSGPGTTYGPVDFIYLDPA